MRNKFYSEGFQEHKQRVVCDRNNGGKRDKLQRVKKHFPSKYGVVVLNGLYCSLGGVLKIGGSIFG